MIVRRLSAEKYAETFKEPLITFNSVPFSQLNGHKCMDVHYLAFCDDKGTARLGLTLGEREDLLCSPFSAPFGGFDTNGSQRPDFYIDAVRALREYSSEIGKSVRLTLPPACYDFDSHVSRQYLALLSEGAELLYSDYNYHYPLSRFGAFYDGLWPAAARNLRAAERNGLTFEYVEDPTEEDISEIYDIVYRNHTGHGYPVHLSLMDVCETSKVVKMDFFIVRDQEGVGCASAIIYRTAYDVAQLIYWGDLDEYRRLRPMSLLSFGIITHYAAQSVFTAFDLGPASSDGVPALGLCDFKESLGCCLTPKPTLKF